MIDPGYFLAAFVGGAIGAHVPSVADHALRIVRRWQYERIERVKAARHPRPVIVKPPLPAWFETPMPQDRDEAVLYVLRRQGDEPIGPTDIGRAISQPWVTSSVISRICKRIGATEHPGGKYTSPVAFMNTQPGSF